MADITTTPHYGLKKFVDGYTGWGGDMDSNLDIIDSSIWAIQDTVGLVRSVAGRQGDVVLTASDIGGLAASATIDTTDASNITSGTLNSARLPATLNAFTVGVDGEAIRLGAANAGGGWASGNVWMGLAYNGTTDRVQVGYSTTVYGTDSGFAYLLGSGKGAAITSGSPGNAPTIYCNASQQVGITQTNPKALLHLTNATADVAMLEVTRDAANAGLRLLNYSGANSSFRFQTSSDLSAWTDSLFLKLDGKVGIGGSPTYALDVVGSIRGQGSGGVAYYLPVNQSIRAGSTGSTYLDLSTTMFRGGQAESGGAVVHVSGRLTVGQGLDAVSTGSLAQIQNSLDVSTASAATSGANNNSGTLRLVGTYWDSAASQSDYFQLQNVMGAGANPTAKLTLTHAGTSGAASITTGLPVTLTNNTFATNMATGALVITGGVTATSAYFGINTPGGNNGVVMSVGYNTASAGTITGIAADIRNPSTGPIYGMNVSVVNGNNSGNGGNLCALYGQARAASSGTTNAIYGVQAFVQNTAAASTLTNAYDFYALNGNATGTIGTQYGLYVEALTVASTSYAIFTAGTTPSQIGGNLTQQIPTAATSGANNNSPTHVLGGTCWNSSVSIADQWTIQNVLGSGANPTSTLTFTHTGSSGAAVIQFPSITFPNAGSATITGTSNTVQIGTIGFSGSTIWQVGTISATGNGTGNVTETCGGHIIQQTNAATSGNNYNSPTLSMRGTYWNSAASAADDWTIQSVLGTGANPITALTISHPAGTTNINNTPSVVVQGARLVANLTPYALAVPVNGTHTTASTGGTLVPGTYYYRVAAVTAEGNYTSPSTETSIVVPAGTNTNTVTVVWGAVTGAVGYRVYGRTTGAELYMAVVGNVTSWVDNGSVTPAGAMSTKNFTGAITGNIYMPSAGTGTTPTLTLGVQGFNNGAILFANASTTTGVGFIAQSGGQMTIASTGGSGTFNIYTGTGATLTIDSKYNVATSVNAVTLTVNNTSGALTNDLLQLQVGGSTLAKFDKSGILTVPTLVATTIPVYANNAAAITGGLTAGALYRTGADPDPVCIVH